MWRKVLGMVRPVPMSMHLSEEAVLETTRDALAYGDVAAAARRRCVLSAYPNRGKMCQCRGKYGEEASLCTRAPERHIDLYLQ